MWQLIQLRATSRLITWCTLLHLKFLLPTIDHCMCTIATLRWSTRLFSSMRPLINITRAFLCTTLCSCHQEQSSILSWVLICSHTLMWVNRMYLTILLSRLSLPRLTMVSWAASTTTLEPYASTVMVIIRLHSTRMLVHTMWLVLLTLLCIQIITMTGTRMLRSMLTIQANGSTRVFRSCVRTKSCPSLPLTRAKSTLLLSILMELIL
jgi:hypothetical protein